MPDTRGDVLCPTCGRWTPPAPFCTECGAALQVDVRDPDGGVFRRGSEVAQPGAPWAAAERFEPEPEDQVARAAAADAAAPLDNLAEPPPGAEDPPWPVEPGLAAAAAAGAAAGAAASTDDASLPPPASQPPPPPPVAPPPATPPAQPPTVYSGGPPSSGDPESDGGVTGRVFVIFLGIGILALLGGAILGGVFDAEPGAEASPSPSLVATATPQPTEATPEPTGGTPGPSVLPSATAAPSLAEPTTFPDGFLARAEPCIAQPTAATCDNSGAVNSGDLWILVSFRHGVPTDVLRVEVIDAGGTVRDDGSLNLGFCGSNTDCAGWTYFRFSNLSTGEYSVRVTRNGTLAAVTTFQVE